MKNAYKGTRKKIGFIKFEEEITVEEIIPKIEKELHDDFILDFTYCFRNIPLTVMLIIDYFEFSTDHQLKHLYYGKLDKESNTGTIIDMFSQYKQSVLIHELQLFDKTLKVSPDSLRQYPRDSIVQKLHCAFGNFNRMLEYCEFDKSLACVQDVCEYSQAIIKQGDHYALIIPYLRKINRVMEAVQQQSTKFEKKIALIGLLMRHDLLQISIIFLDQLMAKDCKKSIFTSFLKSLNPR